ncbi:MAG: DUF2927 domain-containing protein [Rhodospirillales bacterium]
MRRLACLAVVLGLAACVNNPTRLKALDHTYNLAETANDPAFSRLAAFFDEAAFGHDDVLMRGEIKSYERVLTRWDLPMRITIGGVVSASVEKKVRERLEYFQELTGVRLVWEGRDAKRYNVKIVLSPTSGIRQRASHDTACFARTRESSGGITSATIFLPYDRERLLNDCLDHELLHAFGFGGHSHRMSSALSYMHNLGRLTAWDEIMLRTLYSPALTTGMHREAAWPILQNLLSEELNRLTAGTTPLPELGPEYWAVFADETPFTYSAKGLPDLPRLALGYRSGSTGQVQTRATFAPADGDPRAEITLASGTSLKEQWSEVSKRWRLIARGVSTLDSPEERTVGDFSSIFKIVRSYGRDCVVFVRSGNTEGRFFRGYHCERGGLGTDLVPGLLSGLRERPGPVAGS